MENNNNQNIAKKLEGILNVLEDVNERQRAQMDLCEKENFKEVFIMNFYSHFRWD
jgi:hypothetical protein